MLKKSLKLTSLVAVSILFLAVSEKIPTQKPTKPNGKELLIADFEDGRLPNLLGGGSGAWALNADDRDQEIIPEIIEMAGLRGSTRCLKLTYDVESSLPAQNGFWTKLMDLDATSYDHLEFDIKGDAAIGFNDVFKVEIKKYKDAERVDKIEGSAIAHATPEWKTVSIPLNQMTGLFDASNPEIWRNPALSHKNLDEFVIIFQDRQLKKKSGVVYFDNLRFVRTGKPGPKLLPRCIL